MAVVWCRELPRERSQSGKYGETYVYKRAFLVRVDDPATPLPDITNAANIDYLAAHPDDSSCKALEFDTKPTDESGLLYTYSVTYQAPPVNNGDGGEQEQPGYIEGMMKIPIWAASSSVSTGPCAFAINNSAGQPLEGLEQEFAEFRLTLTEYHLSHSTWMSDAVTYTNKVNSDTWNGQTERKWKCQGMSAQLQTENSGLGTINYWEVTWEFAYRSSTWNLLPLDIGFMQRVDSSGTPSLSGEKWKEIKGQDGKPVKQPVALAGGVAVAPGTAGYPMVINDGDGEEVYGKVAFSGRFGSVFTP
jgi:hypothetical protein